MLHSSMSNRRQWRRLVEQLEEDYRVIAIDLIGYGESAMPLERCTFGLEHEVEHVLQVLSSQPQPVERFHLIGHSYGGAVALKLAHAQASRIRSLLLYEPTSFHLLPRHHPALSAVKEVAAIVEESASIGVDLAAALISTEAFIDFWNGVGSFASMPEHDQVRMAKALPKTALDFQALFNDSLTAEDYRELAVSTCVISGSNSPNCAHQIVAVLAEVLPMRELRWVPAGHMAPVTHSHLVNPMVKAFLESVEAMSASVSQSPELLVPTLPSIRRTQTYGLATPTC